MIARDMEEVQPLDTEEQAGPYPIEQLQVCMPLALPCVHACLSFIRIQEFFCLVGAGSRGF